MIKRVHIESLFILLIILFTLIAYYNTLSYGLMWDDYSIIESHVIRELSISRLFSFFVDRDAYHAPGEIYRPLYLLSFTIDFFIHSVRASGYHLTNVALHAIASISVFFFVSRVIEEQPSKGAPVESSIWQGLPACIAAIIFAVHPVHTESVAWIKGRDDIICLIFIISSFLLFISSTRDEKFSAWRYAASLVTFLFALFSKEMAVTLPLLLILFDLVKFPERLRTKRHWFVYLPYFILLGLYFTLRTLVLGQVAQTEYMGGTFLSSFYSTANGFIIYLKLLVLPISQCADYLGFPISSSLDLKVLSSFIILALILAIGLYAYKFSKSLFFLVLFYFITLLPVSNLIAVKINIAERFLYIPSVAFVILAALVVRGGMRRRNDRCALTCIIIVALVIFSLYTAATIKRGRVWANGQVFWGDVVKKYPTMRSYLNYGLAFEEAGDLESALYYYKLSVESSPTYASGYNNVGVIMLKKGEVDSAILNFKKALSLGSSEPLIHVNLGRAFARKSMRVEAIKELKIALELNPRSVVAREALAKIYINTGKPEEAQKILGR